MEDLAYREIAQLVQVSEPRVCQLRGEALRRCGTSCASSPRQREPPLLARAAPPIERGGGRLLCSSATGGYSLPWPAIAATIAANLGDRVSEKIAPAAGSDPRIGALVADKYTIVRLIGRGGMGTVYEARHATLSRRFAIKFMQPEYALRPNSLLRFENEAKLAGSLEHPNLAAVMDYGRAEDGSPYLVMEYLDGEDCARLLQRTGPMPVARAVDIVSQTCRGLAVAHGAGVVHRDLKPENLFVTHAGDGRDLVKVLDFGIAKLRSQDATSVTGSTIMGTCYYMSPEQARDTSEVDERADVWSLGACCTSCSAGASRSPARPPPRSSHRSSPPIQHRSLRGVPICRPDSIASSSGRCEGSWTRACRVSARSSRSGAVRGGRAAGRRNGPDLAAADAAHGGGAHSHRRQTGSRALVADAVDGGARRDRRFGGSGSGCTCVLPRRLRLRRGSLRPNP